MHINIPFVNAIAQMPSYAKILKEIRRNKRKLEDYETVRLNEEYYAILLNKLPLSLKIQGVLLFLVQLVTVILVRHCVI